MNYDYDSRLDAIHGRGTEKAHTCQLKVEVRQKKGSTVALIP